MYVLLKYLNENTEQYLINSVMSQSAIQIKVLLNYIHVLCLRLHFCVVRSSESL